MKIVIIEDEPLMADALKEEILKVDASIEVIATLSSIRESIAYLSENEMPDLFFSDIQLSDGISFEIFKHIKNTKPIIFCTAYDQYALQAFKVHGIDYILKPFDGVSISETIQKYHHFFAKEESPQIDFKRVFKLLENRNSQTRKSILVRKGEKIIPVIIENIALVNLRNGIVYIQTFDQQQLMVSYTMDKVYQLLGGRFYRINRQYIINRNTVKSASEYFARKLLLHPTINLKEELIVSKANVSKFLKWLETE